MSEFDVAREVLSGLPAYARRPNKTLASRKNAEVEIAYWMSRSAILATAIAKLDPGLIEYESWSTDAASPPRKED